MFTTNDFENKNIKNQITREDALAELDVFLHSFQVGDQLQYDQTEDYQNGNYSDSRDELEISEGWNNFAENVCIKKAKVLHIKSTKMLCAILAKINELNDQLPSQERITARPAGGNDPNHGVAIDPNTKHPGYRQSFSLSLGAAGEIELIQEGEEFNDIEIKIEDGQAYAYVGSSVQLIELEKFLEKHGFVICDENGVPVIASLLPWATIAGFFCVGGNGSGPTKPIGGSIVSFDAALVNGEIERFKEGDPDFEKMRTNAGVFGVMTKCKIRLAPVKKIEYEVEVMDENEAIKKLEDKTFFWKSHPYTSVMIVYGENNFKNVIVYHGAAVDKNLPNENYFPTLSHWGQRTEVSLDQDFHTTDIERVRPSSIPFINQYGVAPLAIGNKNFRMRAPWPAYHYRKEYPTHRRMSDTSYVQTVDKTGLEDELIANLKKVREVLDEFKKAGVHPLASAQYIRFTEPLPPVGLNLTQTYDPTKEGKKINIYTDLVTSEGIPGAAEFLEVMNHYFDEKGALYHLGKLMPKDMNLREKIGAERFDDFVNFYKNFYEQRGLRFDNMLLTPHFCDLLQLGEKYRPLHQPEITKQETEPQSFVAKISHNLIKFFKPYIERNPGEMAKAISEVPCVQALRGQANTL